MTLYEMGATRVFPIPLGKFLSHRNSCTGMKEKVIPLRHMDSTNRFRTIFDIYLSLTVCISPQRDLSEHHCSNPEADSRYATHRPMDLDHYSGIRTRVVTGSDCTEVHARGRPSNPGALS
jgi:hypothetical protein